MPSQGALITARLDEETKAQGNLALQQAGCTPSQAVQALWQYAAHSLDKPDELARTLNVLRGESEPKSEVERKLEASERTVGSVVKLRKKLGTENVKLPELSWRELRELEYEEQLGGVM